MENTVSVWVAVLTTIGGLLGGTFGAWLLSVYQTKNKFNLDSNKQTSEIRMSENEQAFKIYKDLLDSLRKDVSKMTDDMAKLESDHLKCREENAALKTEIRSLAKEIDNLQKQSGNHGVIPLVKNES